jgi:hypothetical protein
MEEETDCEDGEMDDEDDVVLEPVAAVIQEKVSLVSWNTHCFRFVKNAHDYVKMVTTFASRELILLQEISNRSDKWNVVHSSSAKTSLHPTVVGLFEHSINKRRVFLCSLHVSPTSDSPNSCNKIRAQKDVLMRRINHEVLQIIEVAAEFGCVVDPSRLSGAAGGNGGMLSMFVPRMG